MAKFTRLEVAVKMAETGMVPLFYHSDIDIAKKLIDIAVKHKFNAVKFQKRDINTVYSKEIFIKSKVAIIRCELVTADL